MFFPLLRIYSVRFNIPKMYIAVHNLNAYVLVCYLHTADTHECIQIQLELLCLI